MLQNREPEHARTERGRRLTVLSLAAGLLAAALSPATGAAGAVFDPATLCPTPAPTGEQVADLLAGPAQASLESLTSGGGELQVRDEHGQYTLQVDAEQDRVATSRATSWQVFGAVVVDKRANRQYTGYDRNPKQVGGDVKRTINLTLDWLRTERAWVRGSGADAFTPLISRPLSVPEEIVSGRWDGTTLSCSVDEGTVTYRSPSWPGNDQLSVTVDDAGRLTGYDFRFRMGWAREQILTGDVAFGPRTVSLPSSMTKKAWDEVQTSAHATTLRSAVLADAAPKVRRAKSEAARVKALRAVAKAKDVWLESTYEPRDVTRKSVTRGVRLTVKGFSGDDALVTFRVKGRNVVSSAQLPAKRPAAAGTALLTEALDAPAGASPANASTVPSDACPTPTMPYDSWWALLDELDYGASKAVGSTKGSTYRLVHEQQDRRTVTTVTSDRSLRRKLTRDQVTSADGATVLSDSRNLLFFTQPYGEDGNLGLTYVRRNDAPATPLSARNNGALKRLGKKSAWIAYSWEDPSDETEYVNQADALPEVLAQLERVSDQGAVLCVVDGDTITLSANNAETDVTAQLTLGAFTTGPAVVSTNLTVDDAEHGRSRYVGTADYTRTVLAKPGNIVSGKAYYRAHLASYLALYARTVRDEAAADVRKASTVKKRVAALRAHAKEVNKRLLAEHTPSGDDRSFYAAKAAGTTRGVTYTVRTRTLESAKGKVTFTVKGKKIVTKLTVPKVS